MRRPIFAFLALTVVSAFTLMPALGAGSAHAQQPGALPATGTGGDSHLPAALPATGTGGDSHLPAALPATGTGGDSHLPAALPATGTGGVQADNTLTAGLMAVGALMLLAVAGSTGLVAYRRSR